MFTNFGRGRLNSDGDRRGSLCGVRKFCDFWHNSALYLTAMAYEEKAMTHIGPPNRASEPDRKLQFSTFGNPRCQDGVYYRMSTWLSSIDSRCSYSVSQLWAFMFVVHTSNCHGQNCTRRAILRLGIDTLIANILVSDVYHLANSKNHWTELNRAAGITGVLWWQLIVIEL